MNRPDRARLVVLESTKPPDGTTRYIDQVVTFAPESVEFRFLTPANMLRRVDVFHVHWPEVIVRGKSRAESLVRCFFLLVVLRIMAARKTAILRTIHNLEPHEPGGSIERWVLQRLDNATDLFVTINPITPVPRGRSVYIPHAHYRDRFAQLGRRDAIVGRIAYAGIIRPYKGVEQLLAAFMTIEDPSLSLHVVGKPTEQLRTTVQAAEASDSRIQAIFGFVPDETLVEELTSSTLVCLPYAELHNSGMLIVALSLGCPVLVPDTETTRSLAVEVGGGWVRRFQGELTGAVLASAIEDLKNGPPQGTPKLENRDWDVVADSYARAFEEAVNVKRSGQ